MEILLVFIVLLPEVAGFGQNITILQSVTCIKSDTYQISIIFYFLLAQFSV